jgi:hypothetical protein
MTSSGREPFEFSFDRIPLAPEAGSRQPTGPFRPIPGPSA